MRGKTRKIVDREVWGASPLRLAPPEDVKVTTQWSKKLGTKVRSSTAADEAYEFLIDLLGKDRIPNKKEKVIAEARGRREARRRERDRNWRRARRRAGGMVAREIYECNSITKREPWKAFDWSRRTWERHGKPEPDVAGVSSPILAGNTRRQTYDTPRKPHRPKARRTAQRRRHFAVGDIFSRNGEIWWPPPRPQPRWHFTGFHRLALVPVKIVYAPDADPPIQIKETHDPPIWLDASDVGEDEQRLFYETLLLGTPWLSANLRCALLKETGISRHRAARSQTFSLWLEVNKCRRRLRRERDTARCGKKIISYNGLPIARRSVKGNLCDLAIVEVAAKHNITPAALRKRIERHRPSQLCPPR